MRSFTTAAHRAAGSIGVGAEMERAAWLELKRSRKRGPKKRGKVTRSLVTRNAEEPLGLVTVKRRWERSRRGRGDEDAEDEVGGGGGGCDNDDDDDDDDDNDNDDDDDDDDDDGDDDNVDDELTPVEDEPSSLPLLPTLPPSPSCSSEKSPASSKGAIIAVTSRCRLPSTAPPKDTLSREVLRPLVGGWNVTRPLALPFPPTGLDAPGACSCARTA